MKLRGLGRDGTPSRPAGTYLGPAGRLLFAAGLALGTAMPAFAQEVPGSAELDPSAPLAPLPDLGVEWPELESEEVPTGEGVEQTTPEDPFAGDEAAPVERRYAVAIAGVDEIPEAPELVEAFDEQSALKSGQREPANAAQIDRRSRGDAELLTELLRSRGYFDATVEPRVEPQTAALTIILEAAPGRQYRFDSVELPGLAEAGAEAARLREVFAVKEGDAVDAQAVEAAGVALQVALGERGFALAEIGEQQIDIDHRTGRARLVLPVEPGPVARFGAVRVSGGSPFDAEHVATIARFKPGEAFERSKVDDLRRALVATGLVSAAEVTVVPTADRQTVDVAVRLDRAPLRTVAGEFGYGTGEGIRAEASWQHRNFFQPEGALTLRGVAGTREQLVSAHVRRNNFGKRDQVLNLLVSASNSELEAYEAKTLLIGAGIERQSNIIWHKKWTWSVGADLLATDERGVFADPLNKETRTFFIGALPASLAYDGSNDLLDPTTGFRLGGRISPEFSVRGGSSYVRAQLDGSIYRPFSSSVVGAARVRLGTIAGTSIASIAPSRRHYSGGGGSVRGYGYQSLGPRDAEGDPIGGRGLAEFALEARVRLKALGGNFGLVPFLDGGTLSDDTWPDFREWQFGAGMGVRYYSRFGPIRVDLGTPLNPRSGDSRVAVTVSLGQAF